MLSRFKDSIVPIQHLVTLVVPSLIVPQTNSTNRLGHIPLSYIPCDIVTLTERIGAKQSNQAKAFSLSERSKRDSRSTTMHQDFEHQVL
jgi:hypothetical protein